MRILKQLKELEDIALRVSSLGGREVGIYFGVLYLRITPSASVRNVFLQALLPARASREMLNIREKLNS